MLYINGKKVYNLTGQEIKLAADNNQYVAIPSDGIAKVHYSDEKRLCPESWTFVQDDGTVVRNATGVLTPRTYESLYVDAVDEWFYKWDGDFIVSFEFYFACRELGLPTDRLYTVGGAFLEGHRGLPGTHKTLKDGMINIINMTPYPVSIVAGATFDTSIREYRGGSVVKTIQSSGTVSAIASKQEEMEPILTEGDVIIPTISAPKWERVDPLPEAPERTMFIVSETYVAACKELGIPTDRLLTLGPNVIGDNGVRNSLRCVSLVRN